MVKENSKNDILKGVQKLLNQQTTVILSAVDEKLVKVDGRLLKIEIGLVNLETRIGKKLEAMEERWSQKFDKLTTTLDRFLKRMTDLETEFTMMGNDIDRIKRVIKEKLGVEL